MKSALKNCAALVLGIGSLFMTNKTIAQRRLTDFGGGDMKDPAMLWIAKLSYTNTSPAPNGDYSPLLLKPITATAGVDFVNIFDFSNINAQASITVPVMGNENPDLYAGRIAKGGTILGITKLGLTYGFSNRKDEENHFETMGIDIGGGIQAMFLDNKYYHNKQTAITPFVNLNGHFGLTRNLFVDADFIAFPFEGRVRNINPLDNSTGPSSRGIVQVNLGLGIGF